MNRIAAGVAFAWMAATGSAAVAAPDPVDVMEARVFRDAQGKFLPYRLYRPSGGDAGQRFPLVLFLHGAGERGDDNRAQLKLGVSLFVLPESQTKHPCFVVAPQCPAKAKWADVTWGAPSHAMAERPTEPLRLAMALVQSLITECPVDSRRLYVTGPSMGGYGTWDLIMRQPERWAAAVPVCGGADDTKAGLIASLPVWVFHGGADGVVKTVRSRNIVAALRKAGGSPKYTEYAGVGHNSWGRAYAEPELLPWLFSQRKR